MSIDLFLEILGFCLGLLYLWWEYHADARLWFVSVVMPGIGMWLYFSKGLYADFAINIYYLVIAVYGFIHWTRGDCGGKMVKEKRPVTHAPAWAWLVAMAALTLLWILIWWVLVRFTNSTVPVADAFTTALSIVGMWMMARKYAEQWWVWMVVDAVSAGLYLYKGLVFYPVLYAIYTVICIFGYRKWIRIMRSERLTNFRKSSVNQPPEKGSI